MRDESGVRSVTRSVMGLFVPRKPITKNEVAFLIRYLSPITEGAVNVEKKDNDFLNRLFDAIVLV